MTASAILAALPRLSAVVIGDICLDRWCTYDPAAGEPSRETGMPRVGVVKTVVTPGAGGTIANNLAALGVGRISVLGAIGNDGFGVELARALGERKVDSNRCVRCDEIQTFTYTKLVNAQTGVEDLPRVDFINTQPLPAGAESQILDRVAEAVDAHDVVLVSDQAETAAGGVVTPAVRQAIHDLAATYKDKIVFVDSRMRIGEFRGVVLKPNQAEAEAACARLSGKADFRALREHTESPLVIVTHGERGVLLVSERGEEWVETRPEAHPVDICGAGDSFSAGMAMALAAGAMPREAAVFGNTVASITIMKKGTGTASPEEVLAKT